MLFRTRKLKCQDERFRFSIIILLKRNELYIMIKYKRKKLAIERIKMLVTDVLR